MTTNLKLVTPTNKGPQKQTQSRTDTIVVDANAVKEWKAPPFQRPIRVNAKVMALSEYLKQNGGVLPGVLTIGIFDGKLYIVDGQHRLEAWKISELKEAYSDVRYMQFDTMAEMAEEFVQLNGRIVNMRPDDILRGLEATSEPLRLIRHQCPFVGYDQIRRGPRNPIVSMSALLRCWFGSARDIPASGGQSAADVARSVTVEDAAKCIEFVQLAEKAWGRDPEYQRLWSNLNVTMCMWIYRRTVLATYSAKSPKLTKELFRQCLTSLSASPDYLDFLIGRNMTDRDRAPCYRRVKGLFVRTLEREFNRKVKFPSPEWVSG